MLVEGGACAMAQWHNGQSKSGRRKPFDDLYRVEGHFRHLKPFLINSHYTLENIALQLGNVYTFFDIISNRSRMSSQGYKQSHRVYAEEVRGNISETLRYNDVITRPTPTESDI